MRKSGSVRLSLLPVLWNSIALTVALGALSGCSSQIEHIVAENDLETEVQSGTDFRHVIISRSTRSASSVLNVYIGGDGSPWFWGTSPASDPTPRNQITLRMMAADGANAVFVGRPCYYGLYADDGCYSEMWTFSRYSADVVSSMSQVINDIVAEGKYEQVRLIGYSGGGALARLIAPSIYGLAGILTIGANLDTESWVRVHNYLPLHGSENPAAMAPSPIESTHVQAIGEKDVNVPALVTQDYLAGGHTLEIWAYPEFDHVCCWVKEWPSVLARFEEFLEAHSIDAQAAQ